MTDRTTKALLLAIALGLWMNAAAQWLPPAYAQSSVDVLMAIQTDLINIQADLIGIESKLGSLDSIEGNLGRIARGTCSNSKVC